MPLVLDASVALAWAFEEPAPAAKIARERLRHDPAIVPIQWWFEVRNVLVLSERTGRHTRQRTDHFLQLLSRLVIRIAPLPKESPVMELARRHGLTVYDAAYLELALRDGLDLATLDTELAAAARAEGVSLVG